MRPCTNSGGARSASARGAGISVVSASSRLPKVADMPHTMMAGFHWESRASASCVCTPRLLPRSSCHSSTTTSAMCWSRSCASARASSSVMLSGVVTSSVGKRRSCAARSVADVSPVRSPAVQSGASVGSGAARARSVSAASARIGVIHNTVSGGALARLWRKAMLWFSAGVCAAALVRAALRLILGAASTCSAPSQAA